VERLLSRIRLAAPVPLLRFGDEFQPNSIAVATLNAVTDTGETAGATIFRMQLNNPIFR
jgi:hypothetical protein